MNSDRSTNVGHRITPPTYPSAPVLDPRTDRSDNVAHRVTNAVTPVVVHQPIVQGHNRLTYTSPANPQPRVTFVPTRPTGPNVVSRGHVPTQHTTFIVNSDHSYGESHHYSTDLHSKRAWGIALIVLGIFTTIFGACAAFVDPIVTPVVACGVGLGMIGLGVFLLKSSEQESTYQLIA